MIKLVTAFFIIFLSGCASIIEGRTQVISFNTNPDGATVTLNGLAIGRTPLSMPVMKQRRDGILRFTKDGYKPIEISLNSTVSPWFFANIISGGVSGSTTDYLTGSMFEYEPNSFMVTLNPEENQIGAVGLEKRQQILNFIIAGHMNISRELNSNKGQYLESLFKLAGTPESRQAEAVLRLKALLLAYPNISDFSEKATELLLK